MSTNRSPHDESEKTYGQEGQSMPKQRVEPGQRRRLGSPRPLLIIEESNRSRSGRATSARPLSFPSPSGTGRRRYLKGSVLGIATLLLSLMLACSSPPDGGNPDSPLVRPPDTREPARPMEPSPVTLKFRASGNSPSVSVSSSGSTVSGLAPSTVCWHERSGVTSCNVTDFSEPRPLPKISAAPGSPVQVTGDATSWTLSTYPIRKRAELAPLGTGPLTLPPGIYVLRAKGVWPQGHAAFTFELGVS